EPPLPESVAEAQPSEPAPPPPEPLPPLPRDLGWVSAQLRDNFHLVNGASGEGGNITMADVQAMLTNPDCPPELREACQFLADNPALFHALDVANGVNDVDGQIGFEDARAGAERYSGLNGAAPLEPLTMGVTVRILDKYADIIDTAAGSGGRDGKLGLADFEAILGSPGAPPELKAAVRWLMDNPAMFDELDGAKTDGTDDVVSREDLAIAAQRYPI
ncbi:MAG: hypothetical protein AB1758_35845, partial [Candidatus Eremiobacterota bacterium]